MKTRKNISCFFVCDTENSRLLRRTIRFCNFFPVSIISKIVCIYRRITLIYMKNTAVSIIHKYNTQMNDMDEEASDLKSIYEKDKIICIRIEKKHYDY